MGGTCIFMNKYVLDVQWLSQKSSNTTNNKHTMYVNFNTPNNKHTMNVNFVYRWYKQKKKKPDNKHNSHYNTWYVWTFVKL